MYSIEQVKLMRSAIAFVHSRITYFQHSINGSDNLKQLVKVHWQLVGAQTDFEVIALGQVAFKTLVKIANFESIVDGTTLLQMAKNEEQRDIVKLLMQAGAQSVVPTHQIPLLSHDFDEGLHKLRVSKIVEFKYRILGQDIFVDLLQASDGGGRAALRNLMALRKKNGLTGEVRLSSSNHHDKNKPPHMFYLYMGFIPSIHNAKLYDEFISKLFTSMKYHLTTGEQHVHLTHMNMVYPFQMSELGFELWENALTHNKEFELIKDLNQLSLTRYQRYLLERFYAVKQEIDTEVQLPQELELFLQKLREQKHKNEQLRAQALNNDKQVGESQYAQACQEAKKFSKAQALLKEFLLVLQNELDPQGTELDFKKTLEIYHAYCENLDETLINQLTPTSVAAQIRNEMHKVYKKTNSKAGPLADQANDCDVSKITLAKTGC